MAHGGLDYDGENCWNVGEKETSEPVRGEEKCRDRLRVEEQRRKTPGLPDLDAALVTVNKQFFCIGLHGPEFRTYVRT